MSQILKDIFYRHTVIREHFGEKTEHRPHILHTFLLNLQRKYNSHSVCRRYRKVKEESPGSAEHSTS